MIRWLFSLFSIGGTVLGLAVLNQKYPHLKGIVTETLQSSKFHTLEARFSAEQIMETHRKKLLKDSSHSYLQPLTKFSPYLLMQVKYTLDGSTREGVLLWDLSDGEMVISTREWSKTHGFSDCIQARLGPHEFSIVNQIAKRSGSIDRSSLSRLIGGDPQLLTVWLDNCRRKKITVEEGDIIRLHLENPKLHVSPETLIDDRLVTKSTHGQEKLSARFSPSQIERAAQAAFGSNFAIRSTSRVFLPIYAITVQNPDGSVHTSYWNALSAAELPFSAVIDSR